MPKILFDPLHEKQQLAFTSQATEVLYGGAAGGGKSHLMRIKAIFLAMNCEKLPIYIFRRVSNDLWQNHMDGVNGFLSLLAPLIERKEVVINSHPTKIKFVKTGSVINLCHCQHAKDVYKYQGAEIGVLMIDELTHFTEDIYRFLRGRCRVPKSFRANWNVLKMFGVCCVFPQVFCGANPGGIGHGWVKDTFISSQIPLDICQMSSDEGGMLRQYIPAKLSDNPSLNFEQYANQLKGLGHADLVKAMLNGDWDIADGGAFSDLWDSNIHVVKSFRIPDSWYIGKCFDRGSSHPYACLWIAISNGEPYYLKDGTECFTTSGDMFVFKELYGWTGKANTGTRETSAEIAERILKIEKVNNIKCHVSIADAEIFATGSNGRNTSIAQDYANAGVYWVKSKKGRVAVFEKFRGLLRGAIEREGDAGIFIQEHCRQFIRTVPILPLSPLKYDDVDTEAEDHIYDAMGYWLISPKPRIAISDIAMGV